MAVSALGIEAKVRDLAEAIVARDGFQLVDVEYRRESEGWTLRLFIDKEGGVSLDDCQRVSRTVGTVLDVEDPIPNSYNLQVSSPGLDRPLRRKEDFIAALGKRVKLVTHEPISGQRNFVGRLQRAERDEGSAAAGEAGRGGEGFVLCVDDDAGVEHEIPLDLLKRANIVYEWPEQGTGDGNRKQRRSGKSTGRK